jgi:hypothetical protein
MNTLSPYWEYGAGLSIPLAMTMVHEKALDVGKDKGEVSEFERWMKVMRHELTKIYSGLKDLVDPDEFLQHSSERQSFVLRSCQTVFDVGDLMTTTGKFDFDAGEQINASHKEGLHWVYLITQLAWRFFRIEKQMTTTGSVDETWTETIAEFGRSHPITIDIDSTTADHLSNWVGKPREWLALILHCALTNALKNSSKFPSMSEVTIRAWTEDKDTLHMMRFAVTNVHKSKNKSKQFLKAVTNVTQSEGGTFYVLAQYGRSLFTSMGIRKDYRASNFMTGSATDKTATLTISLPIDTILLSTHGKD